MSGFVLPQHVKDHHVLRLEAARDARRPGGVELSADDEGCVAHVSISSRTRRTASIGLRIRRGRAGGLREPSCCAGLVRAAARTRPRAG